MSDNKSAKNDNKDLPIDDLQAQIDDLKEKDDKMMDEQNKKDSKEDEMQAKIDELTEALARTMADLQNYKRRAEEDRINFVKFANAEILKQLIPTLDNFDRCVSHLPNDLNKNNWAKGVVQIHDNLFDTLEKIGVRKIKTVGEKLDPNLHEGLMTGPGKQDIITEEFEPGYTLNNEVIKPAKVKIGDGTKK